MTRRRTVPLSSWRRVALRAWDAPRDPTVYATLDLDCEPALAHIERLRAETGAKVTLTHVVGKCAAVALAENPECNAFVAGGKLVQRDSIDVFFQVVFFEDEVRALPSGTEGGAERAPSGVPEAREAKKGKQADLAGAKLRDVDAKSLEQIAHELAERAAAIRTRADAETARTARMMARMPPRVAGVATRVAAHLSLDWGLDLTKLGIPRDPFGSCMVTNVGVFGIGLAHAPLLHFSRVPLVLTMGAVRSAPSVHEGQLVVRRRMNLGIAMDHRVLDGYHGGRLAKRFTEIFTDPAQL